MLIEYKLLGYKGRVSFSGRSELSFGLNRGSTCLSDLIVLKFEFKANLIFSPIPILHLHQLSKRQTKRKETK